MAWRVALVALLLAAPMTAWGQGLGGFVSPGPLARAHADLDGITRCTSCHEPGAGVTDRRCLDCHDTIDEQRQAGGFHARLSEPCATCHGDHQGLDHPLIQLTEDTFQHQTTGFALRGAHAQTGCSDCHKAKDSWLGLSSDCRSCHDSPHGEKPAMRPLLSQCRSCHGEAEWDIDALPTSTFDHTSEAHTDFLLRGRHRKVECEDCHAEDRFVPIESGQCRSCHDEYHRDQFGEDDCDSCHDEFRAGFQLRDYDHSRTAYPLHGLHGGVTCESCHGDKQRATYRPLASATCADCHDDPHEGQFAPRDCASCHDLQPPAFALIGFDHGATSFPLLAAHIDVPCAECHGEGPAAPWANLPAQDCRECHDDAHEGGFDPSSCASCHPSGTWEVQEFDHDRTRYPLEGAHREAECAQCHGEGESHQARPVFGSCADCHEDEHEGTTPRDGCDSCHAISTWDAVTFDHGTTDFALDGAHARTGCADCHEGLRLEERPTTCAACHEADTPPDHYEGACSDCHGTTEWADASLSPEQHAKTGFVLRAAHADAACATCHAPSQPVSAASPECIACHVADDAHRHQLGDSCGDCHVEDDWLRVRFRHEGIGWPLRGAHRTASCDECHSGSYAGTPDQCGSCHAGERPRDALHSDPLTGDCELCHSPWDWDQAHWVHGNP
jgi:hypothetical protein